VSGAGRHERAGAQTLGFAREAAVGGDFAEAIEWLKVVEVVNGVPPVGWERTRALWLRGETSADGGPELAAAGARGGQRQGRGGV
jgi:hypothetical protein